MRVLLFGAGGFLGRRVLARLVEGGDTVVAVVRPQGHAADAAPGVERIAFDLGAGAAAPDVGRCDAAVFLAQSHRYRDWPDGAADMVAVNLLGATRALELARRAGARRFLLASSGSVYGPSERPLREDAPLHGEGFYALTKRMSEELLESWSSWLETLCLRPFALYGPGQRGRLVHNVVAAVAEGRPVRLEPRRAGEVDPDGFVTSPCFVEDAAAALVQLAASSAVGTLNLAGPEAVSIRSLAALAGDLLGREPVFQVAGAPRRGDLVADTTALQKIVGLEFTRFADGLRCVVEVDFAARRRS